MRMPYPLLALAFLSGAALRPDLGTAHASDDNPYDLEKPAPPKPKAVPTAGLTFAVNVNGRIKSYSDNQDDEVSVLLPLSSPWRCVRRRVLPSARGLTMGTFVCSSDSRETTEVIVATSCGLPGESHNSATLIYATQNTSTAITLKVDCVSVEPMGF